MSTGRMTYGLSRGWPTAFLLPPCRCLQENQIGPPSPHTGTIAAEAPCDQRSRDNGADRGDGKGREQPDCGAVRAAFAARLGETREVRGHAGECSTERRGKELNRRYSSRRLLRFVSRCDDQDAGEQMRPRRTNAEPGESETDAGHDEPGEACADRSRHDDGERYQRSQDDTGARDDGPPGGPFAGSRPQMIAETAQPAAINAAMYPAIRGVTPCRTCRK